MTRDTSSTCASSMTCPARRAAMYCGVPGPPDERPDSGSPYTLGKSGALPLTGLLLAPVKSVSVGDSGSCEEDVSVMRDSELVRSRLCARFCMLRGLESWSRSLASSRESEPRLMASSLCRVRWKAVPYAMISSRLNICKRQNSQLAAKVSNGLP